MQAGARRRIASAVAAVALSISGAFVGQPGRVIAASHPPTGVTTGAPASVVVDNRRITAPAGAYFYGAQFGAMSGDGTHVFLNSVSRLDTTDYVSGLQDRPFDAVAGRIIPMIEPATFATYLLATSVDGTTSVVEGLSPPTGHTIDLYLLHGGTLKLITPAATALHFVTMSGDGSTVVFRTNTSLAPTDTNDTEDLYAWHRATDQVDQVNPGTTAPKFERISADGSRIVFTAVGMLDQPYPPGTDRVIYERTASGLTARGRGTFVDESADGTRLYFNTVEPLVPEDEDTGVDGYVNNASGDHVLTQPSTDWAPLVAVSSSGSQWILTTREALTAADTDTTTDVYLGTASGVTLLTLGDAEAIWDGTDGSFNTGIYETASPLVPGDTDTNADVYRIALDDPSHPEFISAGGGPNSEVHGLAFSPDGSRALLTSWYALLPEDTDQMQDVYEWVGATLHLVTIGDGEAPLVRAWTPDLRRIIFESTVPLTNDVVQAGSWNVYISDADRTAPITEITSPAATTGPDVSIAFGTRGHDGKWFDCSLDGADWTHCASPFTAHDLLDGSHTLAVRAWDAAANMDEATTSWTVDWATHPPTGPTTSVSAFPTWLTTATMSPRWSSKAGSSPVIDYDVRYRRAGWNGGFGALVAWKTATTTSSSSIIGAKGSSYCFSARAHDGNGLVSGWSAESCTAIPLDDRSVAHSASWVLGNGSAYFGGTYVRSAKSGAFLTRTGVVARRIALVATLCKGCGTVRVYWNGKLLRTISLDSTTTVYRKVVTVTTFSTTRAGTLVIVLVGSKRVMIDGLAIRR